MGSPAEERIVAGRYEIVDDLGYGNVHRAIDRQTGVTVALKLLGLPIDAPTETRFRREANAARAIDHPGCVRMLDFGEDREAHLLYIAMEMVEGEPLDDYLVRSGGKLEVEHAVELMLDVLDALDAAHHAGVVHRDLKPSNILLAGDGTAVKVCDFGSAKIFGRHITQLTRPGMVIGTGQYMAPEQARGQECDSRADLYAAGAILFELVTGRPATRASDRAEDSRLNIVFARSLADERRDRFASAREMIGALKNAIGTTVVAVRPKSERRVVRLAAAIAFIGGLGAGAFVLSSARSNAGAPGSSVPRELCAVVMNGEAEMVADRPLDVYVGGEWLGRTPIRAREFAAGALDLEVVDPVSSKRRKMRVQVEANVRRVFELSGL